MDILVNISVGELLDKISSLEIKKEAITDNNKLVEIYKELLILKEICYKNLKEFEQWIEKLKKVNKEIWDAVGKQAETEREKEYNEGCIILSRKVLVNNDLRFRIKDEINNFYGSKIKEQKSYDALSPEDL